MRWEYSLHPHKFRLNPCWMPRNLDQQKPMATDKTKLPELSLQQLFREARTYPTWRDKPVAPELLHELFELANLGPTSMNCCPARFVFLTTPGAKERLLPALMPGNVDKTKAAPVTAIIATDSRFYEQMSKLWLQSDARPMFENDPALAESTAFRNGTLMGGYFILAARALGLDCGPMSGFEPGKVDGEFFSDGNWKVNFLCNLGYGDPAGLYPRNQRLSFAEGAIVL